MTAVALLEDTPDCHSVCRLLLGTEVPEQLRPGVWRQFLSDPSAKGTAAMLLSRDRLKLLASSSSAAATARCRQVVSELCVGRRQEWVVRCVAALREIVIFLSSSAVVRSSTLLCFVVWLPCFEDH